MRTLFIILFTILSFGLFGQTTELRQVEPNLYIARVYDDGELHQIGFYKNVNGELEQHGKWIQYTDLGKTVAKFNEGIMIWIKVHDSRKYTKSEIEVMKLKMKVAKLETLLPDN